MLYIPSTGTGGPHEGVVPSTGTGGPLEGVISSTGTGGPLEGVIPSTGSDGSLTTELEPGRLEIGKETGVSVSNSNLGVLHTQI